MAVKAVFFMIKLFVRANFFYFLAFHDHDFIGLDHGGKTVGDDDSGFALGRLPEGFLNIFFRL